MAEGFKQKFGSLQYRIGHITPIVFLENHTRICNMEKKCIEFKCVLIAEQRTACCFFLVVTEAGFRIVFSFSAWKSCKHSSFAYVT